MENITPEKKRVDTKPSDMVETGESKNVDELELNNLGYGQELKREFTWFQLCCYSFCATNSWIGLTGGFSTAFETGGAVCIVWGLLVAFLANIALGLALSELISAYPNSGGPYFWSMCLAPRRFSRVSGYITGWTNICGSWCCSAANMTAVAGFIFSCVRLYLPHLEIRTWHHYLLSVGLNIFLALFNLNFKVVTKFAALTFAINMMALLCVTIAVPAASQSYTNAEFIFINRENVSGWSSEGMSFISGLVTASWSWGVLDSATHLAEEIPHPERNVPKAIMGTVVLGFITTFPLACLLLYCLTDFSAVVAAKDTGSPLMELFWLSSGSKGLSVFLMLCVIVAYCFGIVSLHTYQCRLLWAFSRDFGAPFSSLWSHISPTFAVPVYAHLMGIGINILLAALLLASTTAFNSFITGGLVFPLVSCVLPLMFSIWRGGNQKKGPFHMGYVGLVAKVIALCYCLFTVVMYSFPFKMPATTTNMNYISAIYGGVAFILTFDWWFRGRKQFIAIEERSGTWLM